MSLQEVFFKIVESYNYITTKDARLWFKAEGCDWELVKSYSDTLEDFPVKEGDIFMVELKFMDRWPRDGGEPKQVEERTEERRESAKGSKRTKPPLEQWRQKIEVGDRVDVWCREQRRWRVANVIKTWKDKVKVHFPG